MPSATGDGTMSAKTNTNREHLYNTVQHPQSKTANTQKTDTPSKNQVFCIVLCSNRIWFTDNLENHPHPPITQILKCNPAMYHHILRIIVLLLFMYSVWYCMHGLNDKARVKERIGIKFGDRDRYF